MVCTAFREFPEAPLRVCDDRCGGDLVARDCSYFEATKSKDDIKVAFKDFVENATLGSIAAEYPDMAALMWVLTSNAPEPQNSEPLEAEVLPPVPKQELVLPTPKKPPRGGWRKWWAGLWT